jgi:hypothetical protein
MTAEAEERRFVASRSSGEVSALLLRPADARLLLVLGHGAGAGMRHSFMEALAATLAGRGVATLRYQFPYIERGSRRPDPEPVLRATVRAAIDHGLEATPDLPLFAGGKSMGGRMTSLAMAESPHPAVRGLVFFGFPLHAPGRPGDTRAAHLSRVRAPMLFLQGTRDDLADLPLMRTVCSGLGDRARLHVLEGADHSFHVLKRSGRTDGEVLEELAGAAMAWFLEVSEESGAAPPRA